MGSLSRPLYASHVMYRESTAAGKIPPLPSATGLMANAVAATHSMIVHAMRKLLRAQPLPPNQMKYSTHRAMQAASARLDTSSSGANQPFSSLVQLSFHSYAKSMRMTIWKKRKKAETKRAMLTHAWS